MHWTELIVLEKKNLFRFKQKTQPLSGNHMFEKSEIWIVAWVLLIEIIQLNVYDSIEIEELIAWL